jgi:hypothetical protein
VNSILTHENPVSLLKDSLNLSKQFEMVESSMLNQFRGVADQQLQESLAAVQAVIAENSAKLKQATSDFLAPLQKLGEEIRNTNIFGNIKDAGHRAREVAAQQAKLIREVVEAGTGQKPAASEPSVPVQHIRLSTMQPLGKALTNEEEVNSFIDKAHGKLLEAVKKGPVYLD